MLSYLWDYVWPTIYISILRPFFKWIVTRVTGKCELLRLTDGKPLGSDRTSSIEFSLRNSKSKSLQSVVSDENVDIDRAISDIMSLKCIKVEVHPRFDPTLRTCLCQICGYRDLINIVENVRKTTYNSDNAEHEQLLGDLWNKLMPDTPLESRVTKQWDQIGFQGDDPQTDFRGMGMLGLLNLCFFVEQYNSAARTILTQSHHPKHGFSFAIVGINLTQMARSLLVSGALKTHMYNLVQGKPKLEHFHQVYCYLFYEFSQLWFKEKPCIMDFNTVRERFHNIVKKKLKDKTCVLHSSFMST